MATTSTAAIKAPAAKSKTVPTASGGVGGALVGMWVGGPVGAFVGTAIGAAIGYFYGSQAGSQLQSLIPPSALQNLGLNPSAPVQPHLATVAQVTTTGAAVGPARDLYAYLKVHGPDGTSDLAGLVSAFQSATNGDPNAIQLTGPLPLSGVFDVKTSAALTMYSHDPIAPATPPAPQPPPTAAQVADIYLPGAAATSGYNLYVYLKAHGNSPSDMNLQRLVHQFQIDVDTDPKYPGPASQPPFVKIVTQPLPQSGIYDQATANALTVVSNDAIKP